MLGTSELSHSVVPGEIEFGHLLGVADLEAHEAWACANDFYVEAFGAQCLLGYRRDAVNGLAVLGEVVEIACVTRSPMSQAISAAPPASASSSASGNALMTAATRSCSGLSGTATSARRGVAAARAPRPHVRTPAGTGRPKPRRGCARARSAARRPRCPHAGPARRRCADGADWEVVLDRLAAPADRQRQPHDAVDGRGVVEVVWDSDRSLSCGRDTAHGVKGTGDRRALCVP